MNFLSGFKGIRAGRAFALLAVVFVLTFGVLGALVVLDQPRVINAPPPLQEPTVPGLNPYPRPARNPQQVQ